MNRGTDSVIMSDEDAANLSDLLEALKNSSLPDQFQIGLLESAIERAKVVASDSVPLGVVTIYCTVRVVDLQTGKKKRYTLVWPELADMAKRLLSVSAPIGIALLGHQQGDVIEVKVPGGTRLLKIECVRYREQLIEHRIAQGTRRRGSVQSFAPP